MESRFSFFVLTVLFGGSVAALGIQDINARYGGSRGVEQPTIVEDLYGARMIERAQFSPQKYAEAKAAEDKLTENDRRELKDLLGRLVP